MAKQVAMNFLFERGGNGSEIFIFERVKTTCGAIFIYERVDVACGKLFIFKRGDTGGGRFTSEAVKVGCSVLFPMGQRHVPTGLFSRV